MSSQSLGLALWRHVIVAAGIPLFSTIHVRFPRRPVSTRSSRSSLLGHGLDHWSVPFVRTRSSRSSLLGHGLDHWSVPFVLSQLAASSMNSKIVPSSAGVARRTCNMTVAAFLMWRPPAGLLAWSEEAEAGTRG